MAAHGLQYIVEDLKSIADELEDINFDTGTKPSDTASQDDWQEFSLDLIARIADAEKAVLEIATDIRS